MWENLNVGNVVDRVITDLRMMPDRIDCYQQVNDDEWDEDEPVWLAIA